MKRLFALILAILLVVSLAACSVQEKDEVGSNTPDTTVSNNDLPNNDDPETQAPIETQTDAASKEETEPKATEQPTEAKSDKIDSDFKKAMDAYEAFMDDYVDFMKKYKKNPSDFSLLADYADFMSKYAKFVEDFEKWENEDMNAAETAYYIDVQARVTKKLLEVAQ